MSDKAILYTAWFCPYGQRTWISLVHKDVDFTYIEHDPYDKTPEWLAINPRGLVPAIRHKGHLIVESAVCIEYVDEEWPGGNHLLPTDTYQRAHARIWAAHVETKIVKPYYAILLSPKDKREEPKQKVLDGLIELQTAMSEDGPFFAGKDFGLVDVMLAPYADRFEKQMPRFREFSIPDDERFERYQKWWNAVKDLHSYKATAQSEDRLVEFCFDFEKKHNI